MLSAGAADQQQAPQPEPLGQLVRKLRRRMGLSQEKLAQLTGCSRRWVIDLENGVVVDVRLSDCLRLAAALQVNESLIVEHALATASRHPNLPRTQAAKRPHAGRVRGDPDDRISSRQGVARSAGEPIHEGSPVSLTRRQILSLGTAILAGPVLGDGASALEELRAGDFADRAAAITTEYERLRLRVSPRQLLPPVTSHLRLIQDHLRGDVVPRSGSQRLVSELGNVAVLTGRILYWGLHNAEAAGAYFDLARQAAHEAEDDVSAVYALACSAELLTYLGRPRSAVTYAGAAEDVSRRVTPRVEGWTAAVQAEARAHMGDDEMCLAALKRAHEALDRVCDTDRDPPWIDFFDGSRLAGYEGASLVQLGRGRQAGDALREAGQTTDPRLALYHSEICTDTAWALAQDSVAIDESCSLLASAFELALGMEYRDGLRRIQDVRRQLQPWSASAEVRQLDERLASHLIR